MRRLGFLLTVIGVFSQIHAAQACVDYYVQAPTLNYEPQLLNSTSAVTTINITKFTCTSPVYLRVSQGKSLSYQKRYMDNGSYRLQYNFYVQPTSASAVWGDGTAGTYTQQITGTTSINLYTIIDPQQDIAPGAYSDLINIQFAP